MEDNFSMPSTSLPSATPDTAPRPMPTFIGNTNDMVAIVGAVTAGVVLLCCVTGGLGIYCLPLIPIVLGIAALINAKQSVDSERTRRWGWISLGIGAGVLVLMLVCIVLYVVAYGAMIATMMQDLPSYYSPYR